MQGRFFYFPGWNGRVEILSTPDNWEETFVPSVENMDNP